MFFKVVDGQAIFPLYFIKFQLVENNDLVSKMISRFQYEDNGIVCYSEDELQQVINFLIELNLEYIIENLVYDNSFKLKTENIKYSSRAEVLKHINNNIEPESQKIPNLKNDNNILGQQLVNEELTKLQLQQENNILGETIVDLELRLLQLESGGV